MPKVSEEVKLVQQKAQASGVPFIDLSGKTISADALRQISEEAATFYQIVPIEQSGKKLVVGMINPDDLRSREAVRFIAQSRNLTPDIKIITPTDFKNILKQYRTLKEEVESALGELEKELTKKGKEKEKEKEKTEEEETMERIMAEAPITKIVAVVLRHAQDGRASDIHLEPGEKEFKVRFRVDGLLHTSLLLPKNIQPAVVSRIKILSNLKIDETRVPQDGRFHSVMDGKKIDFRVSTFPTSFGEKVVLRLLDSSVGLMSFDQLGLIGKNREIVEAAIEEPFGMVLITGPTGSGKTTTLYAILRILNDDEVNIVSLEDPVEYYIEGVAQSQIKPEIGYNFASGLRSIVRQDPDVIMVGEIRDAETAELATHAALTGHVVLSTLHTNNALGVIPRLVDMGVERFLIPSSLNVAMAQRLIRRLCPDCRQAIEPPAEVKKIISEEIAGLPEAAKKEIAKESSDIKIWRAPGCKACGNKGTKDRIAIYEALAMTPELERIIIENPTEIKIKAEAERQGMITMKQDGIIKVLKGLISFEELMSAVED